MLAAAARRPGCCAALLLRDSHASDAKEDGEQR
jgi:hypothetical protein